jgi:hypothetical protein
LSVSYTIVEWLLADEARQERHSGDNDDKMDNGPDFERLGFNCTMQKFVSSKLERFMIIIKSFGAENPRGCELKAPSLLVC